MTRLNETLVEASAIAIWSRFARTDNAQWRWQNRVPEKIKEDFREEARLVLEGTQNRAEGLME